MFVSKEKPLNDVILLSLNDDPERWEKEILKNCSYKTFFFSLPGDVVCLRCVCETSSKLLFRSYLCTVYKSIRSNYSLELTRKIKD